MGGIRTEGENRIDDDDEAMRMAYNFLYHVYFKYFKLAHLEPQCFSFHGTTKSNIHDTPGSKALRCTMETRKTISIKQIWLTLQVRHRPLGWYATGQNSIYHIYAQSSHIYPAVRMWTQ